jgi:hypothetical protein
MGDFPSRYADGENHHGHQRPSGCPQGREVSFLLIQAAASRHGLTQVLALMKKLLPLLLFLLVATSAFAQAEPELGPDSWPTTVQATVEDILGSLSDEDKATLRKTKQDDLIMFHHGWGTGIRNHYGLWQGNDKLIESACGKDCHPDDASMVIIEAVWSALQHEG